MFPKKELTNSNQIIGCKMYVLQVKINLQIHSIFLKNSFQ